MYRRITGQALLAPASKARRVRRKPLSRRGYWRAVLVLFAALTWRCR